MKFPAAQYGWLRSQAWLALAFGRRARALQHFAVMLVLRPQDRYALASTAHCQAQLQNWPQALAGLQQLCDAWPSDASAWFNQGYVCQQLAGQSSARAADLHAQAQYAFERALALDAQLDRAWYGLGVSLQALHQLPQAMLAFQKASVLQPMGPYAWYRLAEVQSALGEHAQAAHTVQHLQRFEPRVAAQLAQALGMACSAKNETIDAHVLS